MGQRHVFTTLLYLVVTIGTVTCTEGSTNTDTLTRNEHLPNETMYRTLESLTFTCDETARDEENSHGGYNWYIDGLHITREHRHYMKSWLVVKVSHRGGHYHDNQIVLEAQPSIKTSGTLFCTKKKGRYTNNVVRVFNLVRAIERTPTDKVLGRHGGEVQKCPLTIDQELTLTCAIAVKYINVKNWTWTRNDVKIMDEHSSQLHVTKPGEYTCAYQRTERGGSLHLLTFKVKRPHKSKKSRRIRNWAFCKYSNHVATVRPIGSHVRRPITAQSSGAT